MRKANNSIFKIFRNQKTALIKASWVNGRQKFEVKL